MLDDIIEFVKRGVPMELGFSDEDIENYIKLHVHREWLCLCFDKGNICGVGLMWRISDPDNIPDFPEDENGDYVYSPLVIGGKDMLARMIQCAQIRFPGVKYLCYQREHRGDGRMRIWRLKYEQIEKARSGAA